MTDEVTGKSTTKTTPGAVAESTWQTSRGRRITVRTLLVVAVIFGVLSIFSVWTSQQLLDTNQWTKTSTKLLENQQIRDQVSLYLVDQLYANVDVTGELEQRLPSELSALAPVAASGLRDLAQRGADAALANPSIQTVWEQSNREAHKVLVQVVDGGGPNVGTSNGEVTLNLQRILTDVAQRVGVPQGLIDKIPPSAAAVTIIKSDQLQQAQDAAKLLKTLAWLLGPLALLTLILAVYLARGHRRQTMTAAGFAAIAAGLIVLLARGLIGSGVTDSLASEAAVRPAIEATWSIATELLKVLGWQAILIGLVIIIAAWVAGPSGPATELRRTLAPGLRERPEIGYLIAGAVVLLLVVWAPLPGFHRLFFILLLFVLAPLGVWALRRQTEAEFPDATGGGGVLGAVAGTSAAVRRATGAASAAVRGERPPAADEAPTSEIPDPGADDQEGRSPEQ